MDGLTVNHTQTYAFIADIDAKTRTHAQSHKLTHVADRLKNKERQPHNQSPQRVLT